MEIMRFNTWITQIKESNKDEELNRILDKISSHQPLTQSEELFLSKFNNSTEEDYKDFSYLSMIDTVNKIKEILSSNRKIICDLYDRNGKIGVEIQSIFHNYDEEFSSLILKNGEKIKLQDNFLYNMIYNIKKNEYSLQSQDEYYEKIPVRDDN